MRVSPSLARTTSKQAEQLPIRLAAEHRAFVKFLLKIGVLPAALDER